MARNIKLELVHQIAVLRDYTESNFEQIGERQAKLALGYIQDIWGVINRRKEN